MLDGIDGSGKSTIIENWKRSLAGHGTSVFDLRDHWKIHGTHPAPEKLSSFDVIFSGEPTSVGMGKTIREQMIKNGANYSPQAIAEAYAQDRQELYTQVLIPAMQKNRSIIQDRGVSTSLCYQAASGLSFEEITALPGNALALEYRPDHLIILQIDPSVALERVAGRHYKNDNAIFEKVDFLQKASAVFASPAYQTLFTDRGTVVHYLPADAPPAIIAASAEELLRSLLVKA